MSTFHACRTPQYAPYQMKGTIEFPEDGRIYNHWVGETIQGTSLANGWRTDSINYGYNKEVYQNPYYLRTDFHKRQLGRKSSQYFYYIDGKAVEGFHQILDEWTDKQMFFEANFIRGMAHGKAYFKSASDSIILAEGDMEFGEVVGEWTYYSQYPDLYFKKTYAQGIAYPQEFISFTADQQIDRKLNYIGDTLIREQQFKNGSLFSDKILLTDHNHELPSNFQLFKYKEYHPNGKLALERKSLCKHMYPCNPVGEQLIYNAEGKLISREQLERVEDCPNKSK